MDHQYKFVDNISEDSQYAIEIYTGAAGYDINRYLRDHRPLDDHNQMVVNELDALFSEVPPLKSPITVWRDMDLELHDHIQEGYVSTSTDSDQLDSDVDTEPQCCQYQIEVPAGAKVLPIKRWSVNRNENEILLPRNSYFRYTGREIKRGAIWIHLELINEDQWMKLAAKKRTQAQEKEKVIVETATYIIQLLQSGEIQAQLAEENDLFDEEDHTTLQEYVRQKVQGMIDKKHVESVLGLIDLANYAR